MLSVPVEISARHIHLTREHVEKLFGKGHTLTSLKPVSQTGQFACKETVDIVGNKGRVIEQVRIVGPERPRSQVEVSRTDTFYLGKKAPMTLSGKLTDADPITLRAGRKTLKLRHALIVAQRHIHCSPERAKKLGLKNRQTVSVKIKGPRSLTYHNVKVRIDPKFVWAFQIDTDEGNAAGVKSGTKGEVIL